MSDAVANYENTKRNAPIPKGWMLVEPEKFNPMETKAVFFNSLDQCWEELTIDPVNGAPTTFNVLWAGGATCIAIKDPNYVEAPVAVAPPAFGGMPFATPAPMQAAPVAPVFQAPASAVAAPVIPVAPAIPQVQAAPVPTNIVAFPMPGAIPVMQPAPVAPAAPAFVPPTMPTFPVETDNTNAVYGKLEDDAPFSAADPNEVSAWLAAREGVQAQIDALEKVENELRKRIVKTCFPDGLREGANKCNLPDGRILTITGKVNRTIDDALVPTALTALQAKNGTAPTGLFKTDYKLDLRVFKALTIEDKALLSNCITEKEGKPQLEVKEAK